MKKQKRIFWWTVLLILCMTPSVLATNFQKVEYSEEFLKWMELSEEEKKNVMQPTMYDVETTNAAPQNPFYKARALKASYNARYSLKDVIPENLAIRNQQATYSCWAFAILSSLETNLALANYRLGENPSKKYDFSERHVEYATSKTFLNGEQNEKGYNREVGDGGTGYMAQTYLTNGMGAIEEAEMPFENNENRIALSEIQNKPVSSRVYDFAYFADYQEQTGEKRVEIMNQLKEHIQEHGSIYAAIHGNSSSTVGFNCYVNENGAKFCSNSASHPIDHAISIIGWDDHYSAENFAEGMRPNSNGAWIVRNSWGEKLEYELLEVKEDVFNSNRQECFAQGWNTASEIPNYVIENLGYTVENTKAYKKVGDNGLIYVSYEDCNISKGIFGIEKATDTVDYDNLYQYDDFFPGFRINLDKSNFMLCNIFDKKTTGQEYLTGISLYASETYTCKVYVAPDVEITCGADINKIGRENLQQVALKEGDSETINAGFHTLEFANPVDLKENNAHNNFLVLVEIQGTRENVVSMDLETQIDGLAYFDSVVVEDGKCFAASGNDYANCQWENLGRLSEQNAALPNGDSSIKAYTVNKIEDKSLKDIEIVTPPQKTTYWEGENFDKTGMVVKANYQNQTSKVLENTSYSITNGSNLKVGQKSVTITYEDKSVNQPITVEKNDVVELKIKKAPNKTAYKEGQNFDKSGMEIEAVYKNGEKKVVSDFVIENGNNLKKDQINITISYGGKSIQQEITVTPNVLVEIKVTKVPDKTDYIIGQNFDKTGMVVTGTYEDGSKEEIMDYTIENGMDLKRGQDFVTIEYGGKVTFQTINVAEKHIQEVSIEQKPSKLTYIQNKEGLDLTDGKLKITYTDGTTEIIRMDAEEVIVTGFHNAELGKVMITISYQTKEVQFEVEIVEEETLKNSNLENIWCHIKKVDAYYFLNNQQEDYTILDLEVNGDFEEMGTKEYYYYLTANQEKVEEEYWTKITQNHNAEKQLQFVVDSRKLVNYRELVNQKVIYLYIKEVAIKDGNQSVAISKAMKLEVTNGSNVEVHITGSQTENKPSNDSKNNTTNTNQNKNTINSTNTAKDNTVASKVLPQAGSKVKMLLLILAVGSVMVIMFVKYKNLSKYVK